MEWTTAWHYALDVLPEEAHACQKTLHNYRELLLHTPTAFLALLLVALLRRRAAPGR